MTNRKTWKCQGTPEKPHEEYEIEEGQPCFICESTQSVQNSEQVDSFSTSRPSNAFPFKGLMIGAAFLGGIALGIYGAYLWLSNNNSSILPVTTKCPMFQPSDMQERFSLGDKTLFQRNDPNSDLNLGLEEFKVGNYEDAINYFERAVEASSSDPEPRIYLNNAKARLAVKDKNICPLTLAVVVPTQGNVGKPGSAQEILRGVSDIQAEFNQNGGLNNRLLEILTVNDGNEKEIAPQVAQEISKDSHILGVIGHNSSSVSEAAFPKYDQVGVAMISPTSTSTKFQDLNEASKNQVFFRTVPSDAVNAPSLANYVQRELRSQNSVIFYDSNSSYSQSITEELSKSLSTKIKKKVAIDPPSFDPQQAINESIRLQANTAILVPSTASTSIAIRIAKANYQGKSKLQLLGGDALYGADTLIRGGESVNQLILVVPIAPSDEYDSDANKRWAGKVNWRTVASYDAALALVEAMKNAQNPNQMSRGEILEQLRTIDPYSPASGKQVRFHNGERIDSAPCIIQAVRDAPKPYGAEFGFKRLKCGL